MAKNELEYKDFELVVDDGTESVPVKNKFGKVIGEMTFKPTELTRMWQRYKEKENDFADMNQFMKDLPENAGDDDVGNAMLKAEEAFYADMDYVFGADVYKAFFVETSPFSPVDGKFYAENVMDVLINFMSARIDIEQKRVSKRMKKYTDRLK